MSSWEIPGVNIQWPWSELILSGKKTVETRGYPLAKKHLGKPLALIETPGTKGRKVGIKTARITGIIIFSESFQYEDEQIWSLDYPRHQVNPNDGQFRFHSTKEKWGWLVSKTFAFNSPLEAPKKKGIVFASACKIPERFSKNILSNNIELL